MKSASNPPPAAAVVFDLGRVLIDFDYGRAARGLAEHSALDAPSIRQLIDHSPLLFQLETGLLSEKEFFSAVSNAIQYRGTVAQFEQSFGDIFTPIDAMIEVQSRLIAKGIPTYAFSNTNGIAVAHIEQTYPFFKRFTGTVCSHVHKSMKPDRVIYEALERASGRRGAELIYLDDRPENIEAGAHRGWQTIHVTDATAAAQELARRMGVD